MLTAAQIVNVLVSKTVINTLKIVSTVVLNLGTQSCRDISDQTTYLFIIINSIIIGVHVILVK